MNNDLDISDTLQLLHSLHCQHRFVVIKAWGHLGQVKSTGKQKTLFCLENVF